MKLVYGGNLQLGDPIFICYVNGVQFGLFAGYGRGTVQYYTPNGVVSSNEVAREENRKARFWKSYIHGENVQYRVAKVNPEVLYNREDMENYEKAIEILKQENIIK